MRVQTAEHIIIIISDISHFAQEAGSTGGLIAGEWKGKESLLINRIVMIGPGHYFVIIGGVLAISTYALRRSITGKIRGIVTSKLCFDHLLKLFLVASSS